MSAKRKMSEESSEPLGSEHKRKRVAVEKQVPSASTGKKDDDIVKAAFMPLDTSADKKYVSKREKRKSRVIPASKLAGAKKSAVIYVGRIPHGFYEDEMRGFFSQFGDIRRLRLSRNKTTGKSKHYAFIEFQSPEVAPIVAEAMHNYLLFESMLQVKVVPLDRLKPQMWIGANKPFKVIQWQKLERDRHNRVKTPKEQSRHLALLVKKDQKRRKKIQAVGIDYDYPELKAIIPPTSKKITFNDNED